MGRLPWSSKRIVESVPSISISWFLHNGMLYGLHAGTMQWTDSDGNSRNITWGIKVDELDPSDNLIRLVYDCLDRQTGILEKLNYAIPIVSTPCHFGGLRYWFKCWCGQKVGKLYLPPGERYFDCRQCCNLTYRSCQEHDKRVDALIKNPEMIEAMMKGDIRRLPLALKACEKYLMKKF